MGYIVLAKNHKTNKWDQIGESENGKVSDFEIVGRVNYLNLFKGGHYSSNNIKVIKKENK